MMRKISFFSRNVTRNITRNITLAAAVAGAICLSASDSAAEAYGYADAPHQQTKAHAYGYVHECEACSIYRRMPDLEELRLRIGHDDDVAAYYRSGANMVLEPLIFSGYRPVVYPDFTPPAVKYNLKPVYAAPEIDPYLGILYPDPEQNTPADPEDEVLIYHPGEENTNASELQAGVEGISSAQEINPVAVSDEKGLNWGALQEVQNDIIAAEGNVGIETVKGTGAAGQVEEVAGEEPVISPIPRWLAVALRGDRIRQDVIYNYMMENPDRIQYALWDLPLPPRLPEEDRSFEAYMKSLDLPEVNLQIAGEAAPVRKVHWLHTVNADLQLSQAYISSNWYKGGNDYLALLFNFGWNVELNTVYHPNYLLTSALNYKLGLNSNPKENLHRYSINTDLLQYNLKAGLKAFRKWFYSYTLLFKTQLFTAYPADSPDPKASFLSPGELNMGIGMTYNTAALKNKLKLSVSISPISYNLKTCISNRIDHLQYNIAADRHTASEFGSNAEMNLEWQITNNISWKSRVFLFTNYKYFLADWENTFNFNINRFLSTQFYIYPRFDSSSDRDASKWRYWMLKEILSFGLTYTFSTKP